MELKDQVTSLKLSKKLKELGVEQDSQFYWWGSFMIRPIPQPEGFGKDYDIEEAHENQEWEVSFKKDIGSKDMRCWKGMYGHTLKEYSAFTVAELGEKLPKTRSKVLIGRKIKDLGLEKDEIWGLASSCNSQDESWSVYYLGLLNNIRLDKTFEAKTEAEARGLMLAYLTENNLIKSKGGEE